MMKAISDEDHVEEDSCLMKTTAMKVHDEDHVDEDPCLTKTIATKVISDEDISDEERDGRRPFWTKAMSNEDPFLMKVYG